MTEVRYGLNVIPPRSVTAGAEKTGFAESVGANLQTSWFVQLGRKLYREGLAPDPNYDPFQHMQGYEDYAADLAEARSAQQMDLIKRQIDDNLRDEQKIMNSGWYWTSMFTAGVMDPINIVPIPLLKGVGSVRGALRGSTIFGTLGATAETIRQSSSPTARPEQMLPVIGFSMLLGSTFGALRGARISPTTFGNIKTSLRSFVEAPYRDFYGEASARNLRSGELGVEIVDGDAGSAGIRIDDTFDNVEPIIPTLNIAMQRGSYTGDFLQGKTLLAEGSESAVYVQGNRVFKVAEPYNDPSTFDARVELAQLVDRELGDGSLRLEGAYPSANGTRNPVFSQDYISGRDATRAEIKAYMESRGWTLSKQGSVTDEFTKTLDDGTILTARDLDGANVKVADDGRTVVIDAFIEKQNAPAAAAAPARSRGNPVRRVTVNEAQIKAEFDSQPWVGLGLQPDDIKSPEEWLTFRVIYELNRKQAGIGTSPPSAVSSAVTDSSVAQLYNEPAIRVNGEVIKASDFFPNWPKGDRPKGGNGMSIADEQALDDVDLGPGMPEDVFWGHAELRKIAAKKFGDDLVNRQIEADPENGFGFVNASGEFRNLKESAIAARPEASTQPDLEPAPVQRSQPAAVPRETQMQLVRDTFDELRSRRTAYSYAGALGLEKLWSERISPVGRAVGAFRDDPDSTALPLLLGGDSSVMSRAHQAGATLPASVLVRAQEHQGRFFTFRHTFDHHYLRAVKGPEVAPGVTALGQNMSAAVTGWGQRWNKLRGRSSLTTYDFNEMVGNAVIHLHNPVKLRELIPDDHIRTEALAVAQKHQELMQFYEAEMRRVGMENEIASIEREAGWLQKSRDRKVRLIERIGEQNAEMGKSGFTANQYTLIKRLEEEISTIDAKLLDIPEILRSLKETPRVGPNNEPYFSRFWAIDKVQGEREAFTDMLAGWYEMTQAPGTPGTPRERAERTVAKILDEIPDEVADATSLSRNASPMHLKGRELDIPNTFEWRGVKVSDFIETGVLDVTEAYIRRMAPFIEMARMFGGDRTGQKTIDDMRDGLIERYVIPAAGEDRAAAISKIDEYIENVTDVRDRVIGTFHQRSPWALDNRSARVIRNATTLAQMGGSAITSLVDVARIPMAHGFSTALRAPLALLLGDLEKMRPNLRFAQENGIALEMVNASTAGRVVEQSGIQFGYGGTRAEQWLANRIPGFFKLNLLSQLTVVTKQWANLTAQHHLIRAVKAVADGSAGQDDLQWLASLGINKRDARMMAKMPSQMTPSGELHLPSIHDWPQDVNGMRARQLLASALHQQVNRVIITPSVMDLPNASAGVIKVGDSRYESQLFGLPLQFQSFGIAAANRMMVSGLQGRERSLAYGVLLAISMGMMVDWIKSPDYAWSNKSLLDKVVRGYEISGVGGFLFSDLPQMVEVASQGTVGLRPLLGLPPPYGRTRMDAPFEPLLGPGLGQFTETLMAFTDPEVANTQRALLVKQLVPYNNLLWWNTILRRMVSSSVQNLEEAAGE